MNLDIDTEKGRKTVKEEEKMLQYVRKCTGLKIKITKKGKPIPHDGILINPKNNEIVGIFESKNRQIDLQTLKKWGSWLITNEKINECRKIAIKLKVPFYGFLGIEKDKLVMYWKITDSEGNFLFEFNHYNTFTRETVNGGEAYRDNAFLPIKYGKFIHSNMKFDIF